MKVKFDDVFEDATKNGRKIPADQYLPEGRYPIIDQGQGQIAGYSNDSNGLYCDVPAIIFGDHTRIIKYVETPCFLGADGVKLLHAKNPNANYKYLYYALSCAQIPDTGYNRHFKWLKEIEISIPPEVDQKNIVLILDKINDLITLRKQQLAKLDKLVKARFVEMFGDPQKNTKGLPTDIFENIVKLQRGYDLPVQNRISTGCIPVLGSNGILDYHNIAKVKGGGIITGRSGTIGNVYYTYQDYWPLNTTLFSIDLHGNDIVYLAYLLKMFDLSRFADGTGVPTLNRNNVHCVQIIKAPICEQKMFSEFANKVDKHKMSVQQGLDRLQTLKKALMQKYFG